MPGEPPAVLRRPPVPAGSASTEAPEHGSAACGSPASTPVRAAGAIAGGAILAGALIMLAALIAAPGSWLLGYVSEAGTAGLPNATAYRCGLVLLAAGVGLLGLALRPRSALVALLLTGAAGFATTSGLVPCTSRCPLPPFEPTTTGDVVHTGASILGMIVLTGAIVAVAGSPHAFPRAARWLARTTAALIIPLGATLGVIMLLAGRGQAGAVLERIILVVALTWLLGTARETSTR
jgi:hypothetical protein